jgi:polysaccharide biosynthesis protein PslH
MSPRQRVLFLACHLPFPPLSGGRLRELELIRRISRHFDVHLVVASKTYRQDTAHVHELERFCREVEVFDVDPLPPGAECADAPFQVLRHQCPALTRRVAAVLAESAIDLIHVEGYYLMQHVPDEPPAPVLLVEQNIEYDLERQRSARRGRAHDLRTHRAEVAAWRRADALGVLTTEDREMLLAALPGARVRLVPDGADHVPTATSPRPAPGRPDAPLLVFLGNFGYEPNVDAAMHLVEDVLPRVRARVNDVHLWLVGTDPPDELVALGCERIRITGRVPDAVPFLDAADVVLCPLRIGGGMKVKALEALRRGKCVVSSSVGAQGLPGPARDALAVADDPDAFAAAVEALITTPALREQAEGRSARAARSLPTWDAAARSLMTAYDDLLGEISVLGRAS